MDYRMNVKAIIAAAAVAAAGCSLEMSENGSLDGNWKLESIDTLSTGGRVSVAERHVFWAFQFKLLELRDKDDEWQRYLARFEFKDGKLRIHSVYLYDRENGDKPADSPGQLPLYGIGGVDETFDVESFSGSRMVLRRGDIRVSLYKM